MPKEKKNPAGSKKNTGRTAARKAAKAAKAEPLPERDPFLRPGPYAALADRIGLSERTIRKAFGRDPITYQTACRIAKALQIDPFCFRCIEDHRGRKKP